MTIGTIAETHLLKPGWLYMCNSWSSEAVNQVFYHMSFAVTTAIILGMHDIYHSSYCRFCSLESMAQEVSYSFVPIKITQKERVSSWDGNWILISSPCASQQGFLRPPTLTVCLDFQDDTSKQTQKVEGNYLAGVRWISIPSSFAHFKISERSLHL